ncbi:MAG: 2,3-bisphosphoglycerate-independent phosphoglycerate mutase [Deltaproteobacteria bacterium]|nr:2,3-bisphosphoglycerate-independent phosphoglycerate mutase [Deltaproteobacteria bacterium]
MNHPIFFLIADGMGDRPDVPGGRTPLELAHTPWMDRMACEGLVGTCRTVPKSMPPGSDVANMALLGYDPALHHTGRGPIEAAAQGLTPGPDDLVWRLNLVDLTEFSAAGTMLDYSSGHIDNALGREIVSTLQAELGDEVFSFHPGVQYRHLLVQRNGALGPMAGLNIRPPHDITDQGIETDFSAYSKHSGLLDLIRRANVVLARWTGQCRARSVWPWGQGRALRLPTFKERTGLNGGVVSAVDLVKGLGRAAGMVVPDIPGATGFLDTNYAAKVEAALNLATGPDRFVYVHVEAPDECGHMGDLALKVRAVEEFDANVVGPLYRALGREAVWVVTCDHLTPLAIRTHSSEPVPFCFCAPDLPKSAPASFTERSAARSGLHIDSGHEFLDFILRKMSRPHA